MATTTRAKHRKIEEQQSSSTNIADDSYEDELNKDNSFDYISDNDNFFDSNYMFDNEREFEIENTSNNSQRISLENSSSSSELLVPAKRKKKAKSSTKPKTSFVWQFFSQPIDGKVHCQIANCKAILEYCNTPSTMQSHLHGKHQITKALLKRKSAEELRKTGSSSNIQLSLEQTLEVVRPHSKRQTQKLHISLLKFVVNSMQPLTIVENNDFIKYSYDLDPKYKLPCKKVLKNKIDEAYHNSFIAIQDKISKEATYVSMTLDLWSSSAHIPYLGVTLHWISNQFIPHEILLAIKEVSYPHTAIIIKEETKKLISEFHLETKIVAFITDNDSNMKSAIHQLEIGSHISCAAHTLQL
ncbi:6706_t:CDS:1, partial [Scutellospora calospora]